MLQKDKKKTKYTIILVSLLVMNLPVLFDLDAIYNQDPGCEGKVRTSTYDPIIYVNDWAQAKIDGIATGQGTWADPYVIEDMVINGEENTYCIEIEGTEEYFEIRNCTLFNATYGIRLKGVDNGTLYNNTGFHNNYGLYLYSGSSNNSIVNNTFHHNLNKYGYGLGMFVGGYKNIVSNNNCSFNQLAGIEVSSTHNNISGNDCLLVRLTYA